MCSKYAVSIGDTNSGGLWADGNSNTYYNNAISGIRIRASTTALSGSAFNYTNFDIAPTSPSSLAAGWTTATLTLATCPNHFWPLIPKQILWLNGTSGGLNNSVYGPTAPGPGEFVTVTGGTCTPGASNHTVTIAPAVPGITAGIAHDSGYTISNGATPFIEDNAQATVFLNLMTDGTNQFGWLIQIDNDQGAQLFNINTYGGIRCDQGPPSDFCGATLFGPGPNDINAGIATMYGGTSQNACAEFYNGNDFGMYSTVCEGFNDFGALLSTKRGGAIEYAHINGVHFERGNVSNSIDTNLGAATIMVQGGYNVNVGGGGEQTATFPTFSAVGNPGGDLEGYYLSTLDVTDGTKTIPIPIGIASVTNPSANNVTVKWVTGDALSGKTINYEIYRIDETNLGSGSTILAPYPGVCDGIGSDGKCLVATSISPATVCDIHGECVFTDNVAPGSLNAAAIQTSIAGPGFYNPLWSFSPGGVVLAGGGSYQGDPSCLINNAPWMAPFSSMSNMGPSPGGCMASSSAINNALWEVPQNIGEVYAHSGILLPDRTNTDDGGEATDLKGRINFLGQGTTPRCVVTWWDANAGKTMSTKGFGENPYVAPNRPLWDISDVCTGVDGSGSLFEMFPTSMHFYANDGISSGLPNSGGTNWTEAINATGHTFSNHINQGVTGNFAGTCTMSSGTSCTITLTASYTSIPGCVATVQGTTPIASACNVSGTTVTVTAASSNSNTWAAMLFGNPN